MISLEHAFVVMGAAVAFSLSAGAQAPAIDHESVPTWSVDVAGGMFAQPRSGGRTGPALAVTAGRRVASSRVRISGGLVAARITDVGAPAADRYVVDRDWLIAALGVETPMLATGRLDLVLAGKAGPMWARDRKVGVEGTPVPPGFPYDIENTSSWDTGAAVIPEIRATYRLTRVFALTARAAAIQHVFTDDFFGSTGSLLSLGATFGW